VPHRGDRALLTEHEEAREKTKCNLARVRAFRAEAQSADVSFWPIATDANALTVGQLSGGNPDIERFSRATNLKRMTHSRHA
jgi:hypothetical protein